MMRFLFGPLLFLIFADASGASFTVELTNNSTRVSSSKEIDNPVSVLIKNTTSVKVNSELRSSERVLSRFVVAGGDSKTLQVKLPKNKKLYYVTISPPSQAVELKFNQRDYEIPEQK